VHDLPVQGLKQLFHRTKDNPNPKHGGWFERNFRKVPAYLRRAATMAAHGAVASFLTRYRAWQGGDRRCRAQHPPRWGGVPTWPALRAANGGSGAMIRRYGDGVEFKLPNRKSGDWLWRKAAVVRRDKRHNGPGVPKSPMLIVRGHRLALAQSYQLPRPGAPLGPKPSASARSTWA
jgi:hypothetical protein